MGKKRRDGSQTRYFYKGWMNHSGCFGRIGGDGFLDNKTLLHKRDGKRAERKKSVIRAGNGFGVESTQWKPSGHNLSIADEATNIAPDFDGYSFQEAS